MNNKSGLYYKLGREDMLNFIPPGVRRILEVGCAEGNFGEILKRKGVSEVWGIEVCENVAFEAKKKLDHVLVADIESGPLSLPTDYFDCIVFNDVLEHLRDPWSVLSKIRSSLTDDGFIVASIPNVRYFPNIKHLLIDGEWSYTDLGILDRTHLRFFTKKSIVDLFAKSGFKIHVLTGISEYNSRKFNLLNLLFANKLDDMKYLQFACVAKKV
ncbi:MAG: class I SAM-dependent methyltransferase [Syntrophobacteraceae bacterium]